MKHIQKWSPICLPIVLIVGIVVGWMIAQAQGPGKLPAKLSASPAPPPEVQQLEELKKAGGPPEKKAPNTREGVLEKFRSSSSGNARPTSSEPPPEVQQLEELKKAGGPPEKKAPNTREGVLEKLRSSRSGNARPTPSAPPPDVQQLEELKKQAGSPAQRQPHTVQELLEKVRSAPGGPEMIEEAKKRGARIGMRLSAPGPSLSYLNPFKVEEAQAAGTFSLILNPGNGWFSSNPQGWAWFYGICFYGQYCRQF